MAKKQQPPHTLDELVALVRERFPEMSPQFQIGARYLIDFPAEVPVQSMRRIATDAGVQPATLVRFAQALGYSGWEDMRQVFIRGLHQTPRRYADQAREVVRHRSVRTTLSRHVMTQTLNLQLLEDLNTDRLPAAIRLLQRSRHVHVAGFRASHAAAHTLHYLYRLFRNSVTLLRGDAGLLEMELRALEPRDVVVIIGFAPYSQEGLRVAQAARQRNCRIIAICDSEVAPVAQHAEVTLLFATETPGFFPTSAAAMVLVEVLANQLLSRAGRQAIEALDVAEDQLRSSGAYLEPQAPTSSSV